MGAELCRFRHIDARDRGGGKNPPPRLPLPYGDTSHGPVHGENLKREPACGFALPGTAFPGYLCFMERYSTVVLPWSGEQSICHGFEEKCHR
jgi:hypothetical protein